MIICESENLETVITYEKWKMVLLKELQNISKHTNVTLIIDTSLNI